MKKLLVLSILACSLSAFTFAQLPVNKAIKIFFSADKKQCLQKTDSLNLSLALYKEKPNQEWRIIVSNEPNFYYLQTADGYYLKLNMDTTNRHSCNLTLAPPTSDQYKFSFNLTDSKDWEISTKLLPNNFVQPINNTTSISVMPKEEFGTSTFVIDTVPYRRPKPNYTKFENSMCEGGVLVDEKPITIYGIDATFYQGGGMYPAQFILRVFTSADKKDKIEILVFDDIRKIRKNKSYVIQADGAKNQPSIKLYKNDKPIDLLNQATLNLEIVSISTNTFDLIVSSAKKVETTTTTKNTLPIYDIAIKGMYLLQ